MNEIIKIEQIIIQVLQGENAASVLEISGFDSHLGELMKTAQKMGTSFHAETIDRVDLTDNGLPGSADVYNNVFGSDIFSDIDRLNKYDIIIIFHLFENMAAPDAKAMLGNLLGKANKQVLVITPEYPYDLGSDDINKISDVRAYHPVFFIGMDISYKMLNTGDEMMQAYSFFPNIEYEQLPVDILLPDKLPVRNSGKRKLKIAYVITHHMLTGGMKVLLLQMKAMTKAGHRVTAYYRSNTAKRAVPEWCGLTDDDISGQVIVPEDKSYLEYINDEDIIIFNWIELAAEFANSRIPAALWENGTPLLYGDYGDLIGSGSWQRKQMHNMYRLPVHLLAVSYTVQEVLKGMYGRSSQYFPNGIDIDFYYPAQQKNNETPVILLTGNPVVGFKGFGSAFKVLEAAHGMGMDFTVQIAAQKDFSLTIQPSYQMEKFISPAQEKLAELYRNADIFLSTSLYESFPMPPIEAMASGTAVVAMDCGGINTYAEPGVNCLLCEQGDIKSMLYALTYLLSDCGVRDRLAAAGRETALRHSHEAVIPELEKCLYRIIYSVTDAGY